MKFNSSDNLLNKLKETSEGAKLANTVDEIHKLLSHIGNKGDETIA